MSSNGFQQSAYNKYAFSSSNAAEIELGTDIAKTGNIFMSDPKKHEDLKIMLESNKDSLKLEAMKRIISMVAKGRECGELFPSVVKNVVSKNAEVKKLVYAYLTRYAEEQQDLALLSISTFQRALKDPNQLIRGSALRVLSSIRVPMIVPIMMLAIKDCVMDMSPYVRKIAAHAIPKLYSLDSGMKEQLIEVIEKLLGDKTTLVAGSAIQAFEEVCSERFDLIHKHYRKLCSLLVDVEEWGQVVIINMLTRYARTQFLDPNCLDIIENKDKKFYSEDDSSASSDDDVKNVADRKQKQRTMDQDHRLLINSSRTLLHSRNPAVVMSIVQLFYHCAPKPEMNVVIRALIRLLKCEKEVQYVVLNNIATMSISEPELFQGYIKSFYVYNSDSTQIKLLKLEILTNLASESNISVILRELQNYIGNTDQEFVTATIQAIGRCASNIAEVSDNCLSGLVQLISRKDENIVAEAVVVIRKLLQMQTSDHRDIIVNMALLLDTINVPMAKASIIWLIGEYCDRVPKIAPDVLRKAAKTFMDEKDIVKLQTINLAAKLHITNPKQTRLLTQYVLNLAKYDLSYDIRDRARFVKALLFPQVQENKDDVSSTNGSATFLSKRVKKIFLATKPAPLLQSKYKDRHNFQLGTMSHILNHRVVGYKDLPEWPTVAPDPSVRTVPEIIEYVPESVGGLLASETRKVKKTNTDFYSNEDSESSSESSSSSSESETSNKTGSDKNEEEDGSDSEQSTSGSSEDSDDEDRFLKDKKDSVKVGCLPTQVSKTKKEFSKILKENVIDKESKGSQSESTEDSSSSSSSSEDNSDNIRTKVDVTSKSLKNNKSSRKGNDTDTSKFHQRAPEIDLLLDFDEPSPSLSGTTSNNASILTSVPLTPSIMDKIMNDNSSLPVATASNDEIYMPIDIPVRDIELLTRFMSNYIIVNCQFTRSLSTIMNNPKFVSVTLIITNISSEVLNNVHLINSSDIEPFSHIDTLLPGKTVTMTLGINFKDSTQPIPLIIEFYTILNGNSPEPNEETFKMKEQIKKVEMKIKAPIGELLQPINMIEKEFVLKQSKLRGMNECLDSWALKSPFLCLSDYVKLISQSVYSVANIVTVSTRKEDRSVVLKYAGSSCYNQLPCLIEVIVNLQETIKDCKIKVNSEQITLVSQLAKELQDSIKHSMDNK